MKLTAEQIARVFAMYLGKIHVDHNGDKYPIRSVDIISKSVYGGLITCGVEHCKIELTPLSKISDEDAIEVGNLIFLNEKGTVEPQQMIKWVKHDINKNCRLSFEAHEYLKLKGYAVPLWFGVGHLANGETAIELDIAIDKTLQSQSHA